MTNTGTSRRRFLNWFTDLILAILGLIVAVPAVRYLVAPLLGRGRETGTGPLLVDAGPIADIRPGEWRLVTLEMTHQDGWKKTTVRHAVWVRRPGEGAEGITVLSSICPHLGCPVNWHPDQTRFFCPCHGATFDAEGRLTGGPPPRSMDPLKFEVRAGRLYVRWQDFKIGVSERVPVNV
jgi:menaquinol-cytochrome c reductase iron-sulfur subunit